VAVKVSKSEDPNEKTEGLFPNSGGKHLVTFEDAKTYFAPKDEEIPRLAMNV